MKIKRTVEGKEYEFELTSQELSNAWWEAEEDDIRKEADYQFDFGLCAERGACRDCDAPRTDGDEGQIPGSAAYRDAWRETFFDTWVMWEDGAWEEYIPKHPLTYLKEITLNDMLPYVQETEKWLENHPIVDKEVARKAVMDEFRKSIGGEGPMSGTPSEILGRMIGG